MSNLAIYEDGNPEQAFLDTADGDAISANLKDIGVRFERWVTSDPLPKDAGDEAVMVAYSFDIDRLKSEFGYQSVDVVRLKPDNENKVQLRNKFLAEHTHSDDEVRFFVEGSGMFYLHVEGKVYMLLCESGDLLSVPANTKHWFDMGEDPEFTCIRLFTSKDGWEADYTGDKIANYFPKFEQ